MKNTDIHELLESFDCETTFDEVTLTIRKLLCHYQNTVPDDPDGRISSDDMFNILNLINLLNELKSSVESTQVFEVAASKDIIRTSAN